MTNIIKAGLVYFLIVFAVGFALGTVRVPLLVPALGERYAELMETPFMLAAVLITSRWIVRKFELPGKAGSALLSGIIAALVLLALEFTVVLWLRGITLEQFFAVRDPVAGTIYYLMVAVYAISPSVFAVLAKPSG